MIYKDKFASLDKEELPKGRGEPCLNCRMKLGNHNGWACHRYERCFSKLTPHERYMTRSMLDSINSHNNPAVPQALWQSKDVCINNMVAAASKEEVDVSDWRKWQHKAEGECACGIRREMCVYHRR